MKVLFKGARFLDDREGPDAESSYEPKYVTVEDAVITEISTCAPLVTDGYDRVIDCKGNLLMPGFYNAHCHAAMTLLRGIGEDLPLDRWLQEKIFPAEDHLNFRRVYYGTKLAIAEMLRNGIVSFSDMYMFEDATAEAVLESGMKANLSRSIVSFDANMTAEKDTRLAEAARLVEQYHHAGDGRLNIDMSLHAEYTNVDATCRYVAEYAKEHGLRMQVHVSETEEEHAECLARHGQTPLAYLASMGVLDVPTTAAHCVWVTDDDLALMQEKNVFPVHNPVSNLKLGSGVMRLPEMLDAGIPVALGTDGAASNNALDILRELQTAAILHKGVRKDPTATCATYLPVLATRNGALSQGREDCGLLEVGYRADLILVDLQAVNNIPCQDPRVTLCYSVNPSNVLLTMCDGRILYENGEYTSIDIECLRFEARQVIRHYFD